MKKTLILRFLILVVATCYGQSPAVIKTDLPTVLPPSPTVAALMKFEEVPVNNYTGIPDISIPLFSSGTHSKDINLDVSLKYHSAATNAYERATDVGLGWSLFSGGVISRTVRGLPDEMFRNFTGDKRIGIYCTVPSTNGMPFNYYALLDIFNAGIQNSSQQYCVDEFLWESEEKGKFDTEHDLWQFNFMGFSGRFYIKKVNNNLQVIPLDNYNIKIVNNYAVDPFNPNVLFVPIGFTVFDDKGYKYTFSEIEKARSSTSTRRDWGMPGLLPDDTYAANQLNYNSAFYLTKIEDNNGMTLIDFTYYDNYQESVVDGSYIRNDYTVAIDSEILSILACGPCPEGGPANLKKLEPRTISSSNLIITNTKKLKEIFVNGFAKLYFTHAIGRQDSNIALNETASVFKQLTIRNWNDLFIKKYVLSHSYSDIIDNRMLLSKIDEFDNDENESQAYEFFYEERDADLDNYYIGKDYWGYFNRFEKCKLVYDKNKETSPEFCTVNVLQKIKYPTGGCAIFNFEANQYALVGDTPVPNFDDNPNNYYQIYYDEYAFTFGTNLLITPGEQTLRYSATEDQRVVFYPSIYSIGADIDYKGFILKKVKNGVTQYITLRCTETTPVCCIDYVLEAGATYTIKMFWTNIDFFGTETIDVKYLKKNPVQKEYLYGGGNRIKQIGYFTEDVPKDFYQNYATYSSTYQPAKEKNYNYSFFGQPNSSSGSLVFPKPLFSYEHTKNPCFNCGITLTEVQYLTTFDNKLATLKTQGSDVGYKNVTVSEANNGRTEYTYSSPIDVPELVSYPYLPPYIPAENFDYKRGLLQKESVYDQLGKILKEDSFVYDTESNNYIEMTSIKILKFGYIKPDFKNFVAYNSLVDSCPSNPTYNCVISCELVSPTDPNVPICPCLCFEGSVPQVMSHAFIYEYYGWMQLTSKNSKKYMYPNGTATPFNVVQTNETFQYNPFNKLISQSTMSNSKGEILKTDYYYHSGTASFSQNRISEIERIETFRDTDLLSTTAINYANNYANNISYLPQTISASKDAQAPENRVRYKLYDEFSNVLEVEQEGGSPTSYIWGYSKTQPIAKIENATNAQVAAALGMSLSTVNETHLAQINNLRTTLPGAMVTTYTYVPLVGVSSITDPKGYITNYEYDDFNRLKWVKDYLGNLLSENQYHYKN